MRNEDLIKKINEIGLSDSEARIYLSMLSLGETSIISISRASGIKRSTIYPLIENLKNVGLVSVLEKKMKKVYVAEDPKRLSTIVDRKRDDLLSILPSLEAMYTSQGNDVFIKTYEGVEAMKSVYDELLMELSHHDEYLVIGDPERWDTHAKEYFKGFIKKRLKVELKARLLLTNSDTAKEYKRFEKNFNEEIKILPNEYKMDSNVVITKNKIIIHQLYHPVLTMVIRSKSVIDFQKNLFEIIWNFVA